MQNEKLIYYVLKKLKVYHLRDEYYDVGLIGLAMAMKKYDESKGKFSSYAYKCIENEIKQELRKNNKNIKTISMETLIGENIILADTLVDDIDIEKEAIKKELEEQINEIINELTEEEKDIIKSIYGFETKKTKKQLADKYKISIFQIDRIINRIIIKIRSEYEKRNNINNNGKIKRGR